MSRLKHTPDFYTPYELRMIFIKGFTIGAVIGLSLAYVLGLW